MIFPGTESCPQHGPLGSTTQVVRVTCVDAAGVSGTLLSTTYTFFHLVLMKGDGAHPQ